MEITDYSPPTYHKYKFKIDLIVWKSDFQLNPPPVTSGFKIDLIVWK